METPTPTAHEIFNVSDTDYAVQILHNLFGKVVSTLTDNGEQVGETGNAILNTAIGGFNVAVLFFATVVCSYTVYRIIFDTAHDGEIGGRETNVASTVLRGTCGVACLLPVSGGFSIIQVLVLQLLLWGSALGNYVWSLSAEQLESSATYTASTTGHGDSFVTAGKMSAVLQARTLGFLCAKHANNISSVLATGDDALQPKQYNVTRIGGGSAIYWIFKAGNQYQNKSEMCGSVKLMSDDIGQGKGVTDIFNGEKTFADSLNEITQKVVKEQARSAVNTLDGTAKEIADQIYEGNRNTDSYKSLIRSAVNEATAQYIGGVTDSLTNGASSDQINQFKKSFIDKSTTNGWMFAVTWQRALAAYVTKLNSAKNELTFILNNDVNPKGAATSLRKSIFGYSDTENHLFEQVDKDFSYFRNLETAFVEAGQPNPATQTTLERITADNQQESGILSMQYLYNYMFDAARVENKAAQWSDPLIDVQETGQTMLLAGGLTAAGSWVVDALGKVAAVGITTTTGNIPASIAVSSLSGYLADAMSWLGWGLLIVGFVMAVILPFLPMVYYVAGVISWVIMAVEAVIAAPLWVLLAFAPSRENDWLGTNKQGLLLYIGVFFRPVLMILGLLSCFLVLRIAINFENIMFSGAYFLSYPVGSIVSMLGAFGLIIVYVLLTLVLVTNCCALITGVGEAVMDFIGVRINSLGQNNIATDTTGALNPVTRVTGSFGAGALVGSLKKRNQTNKIFHNDLLKIKGNRGSGGNSVKPS